MIATQNASSACAVSRVDGVIMRGHVLGPGRGLLCAFGPAGRSDLRTRDRPCFSIHKPATSTSQTSTRRCGAGAGLNVRALHLAEVELNASLQFTFNGRPNPIGGLPPLAQKLPEILSPQCQRVPIIGKLHPLN